MSSISEMELTIWSAKMQNILYALIYFKLTACGLSAVAVFCVLLIKDDGIRYIIT